MNVEIIKELRNSTGAGMVDVKKALDEAGGDVEKAREVLRAMGLKSAAKKQERIAGEGIVHAYIHPPGKIGAMVSLGCETDFVARNEEFTGLAHEIAKQAAALSPSYIGPEHIPVEEKEKEERAYREELRAEGKPEDMIEKIIEGKMRKYYAQVCLLDQPWISDDSKTIRDLISEKTAKLGEKIEVRDMARFSIG